MYLACAAASDGVDNGLDWYGVHRIADALAAAAFSQDARARTMLFGPDSAALRFMGVWPGGKRVRPLDATRSPQATRPSSSFATSWDYPINPRKQGTLTQSAAQAKRSMEDFGRIMGQFWKGRLDSLAGSIFPFSGKPQEKSEPTPGPTPTAR